MVLNKLTSITKNTLLLKCLLDPERNLLDLKINTLGLVLGIEAPHPWLMTTRYLEMMILMKTDTIERRRDLLTISVFCCCCLNTLSSFLMFYWSCYVNLVFIFFYLPATLMLWNKHLLWISNLYIDDWREYKYLRLTIYLYIYIYMS